MLGLLAVRRRSAAGVAGIVVALAFGIAGAGAAPSLVAYNVYPLVSDSAGVSAPLADTALVNGWG